MLHKTKGIVLGYIPFRESSVIVKIYTEAFGLQSYIENGVRSARGKNKIALFQPMSILDLVVYHDQKKDLHRLSEMRFYYSYKDLPLNFSKSSIAMFLNEVLTKTLHEHIENQVLFDFLVDALIALDQSQAGFENFHLLFLIKLSGFLGFEPQNAEEILSQLNEHKEKVSPSLEDTQLLDQLIKMGDGGTLLISKTQRNTLLDLLLLFYKIHTSDSFELKSLPVLRELMR